jgi:hypothetical protein
MSEESASPGVLQWVAWVFSATTTNDDQKDDVEDHGFFRHVAVMFVLVGLQDWNQSSMFCRWEAVSLLELIL